MLSSPFTHASANLDRVKAILVAVDAACPAVPLYAWGYCCAEEN